MASGGSARQSGWSSVGPSRSGRPWSGCALLTGFCFLMPCRPVTTAEAEVAPDEEIVFFDTAAHLDESAGEWVLPIHGWIFEPEHDSIKRAALLTLFRETLDLDDDAVGNAYFTVRAMWFLTDNERGKGLTLRAGDQLVTIGPSAQNGHLMGTVRLSVEQAERLARPDAFGRRWIELPVVMPESDPRRFAAKVLLIEPVGLSVISDIDDTIKITQITDHDALLRNTFLRPYRAVAGMAELYERWASRGAVFHYASASPWQLYRPLTEFMDVARFPAGTLHLKTFSWKDSSFMSLFDDPREYKPAVIKPILQRYPRRRFVFVGDSGEKDPEVYGALARQYPGQVLHILIRAVDGETPDAARFRAAFEGLPRERWTVFTRVADVEGANLPEMLRMSPATTTAPTSAPTAP